MNKGLCQNSVAQQMMRGSSGCRSLNSIRPPPEQTFPLLPSSSSPSVYAQFPQPSTMLPITPLHDGQELPESWSQLLPGGCWGEEEKYGLTPLQTRKIETWEDQLLYPAAAAHVADVKREYSGSTGAVLKKARVQGASSAHSAFKHQESNDEVKKDLRSRGLCLVPVSFFLHVGTDTGADFWPPALHGAF
ncbi:hypothetical protein B296_00048813 [Ensete ventricosum]|uniref:Uncharacterized protein n=1 Tax=Ensete ventricosum TaxID=4639 RepID=A0A426X9Z7_ENSVE|nr:hypothetical protein B296_00048813 [Ensete ventricosum]